MKTLIVILVLFSSSLLVEDNLPEFKNVFAKQNEPKRIITRMGSGSTQSGIRVSRLPKGHPEGYIEAFANIYTETADAILAYQKGEKPSDEITYPNLDDGLEGIVFVDACVESAKNNCKWISLKKI